MLRPNRLIPAFCVALFVACGSATEKPGPPPDCPSCHSATTLAGGVEASGVGGGGGSSGVGGNGQGGGEIATVTGNVVVVNNLAFDSASAYTKEATVYGDGPSGKQIGQPYDGATFTISGVAQGDTWFLVTPKDSSDTVFPTYSVQLVPSDKLVLPVLDQQVLSTIGLNAGLALSTQQAQIVIRVSRKGLTLSGITAESAGAGLILYDDGPSSYSENIKITGERGMIVLLNQSGTSITLSDTAANVYHVDVRATAGTASWLDLDLPL